MDSREIHIALYIASILSVQYVEVLAHQGNIISLKKIRNERYFGPRKKGWWFFFHRSCASFKIGIIMFFHLLGVENDDSAAFGALWERRDKLVSHRFELFDCFIAKHSRIIGITMRSRFLAFYRNPRAQKEY